MKVGPSGRLAPDEGWPVRHLREEAFTCCTQIWREFLSFKKNQKGQVTLEYPADSTDCKL